MDISEQHERGLALRTEMFGRAAVEARTKALGDFGKPLQHIINAYAYGDVWQTSALPLGTKSLAMVAMMAAAGHQNELRPPSAIAPFESSPQQSVLLSRRRHRMRRRNE